MGFLLEESGALLETVGHQLNMMAIQEDINMLMETVYEFSTERKKGFAKILQTLKVAISKAIEFIKNIPNMIKDFFKSKKGATEKHTDSDNDAAAPINNKDNTHIYRKLFNKSGHMSIMTNIKLFDMSLSTINTINAGLVRKISSQKKDISDLDMLSTNLDNSKRALESLYKAFNSDALYAADIENHDGFMPIDVSDMSKAETALKQVNDVIANITNILNDTDMDQSVISEYINMQNQIATVITRYINLCLNISECAYSSN